MTTRQQRYRVELEVELEDRGDYSKLMDLFEAFIAPIKDGFLDKGRVRCTHVTITKAST